MKQTILVTGAAGYIGSHTVLELLEADYEVIALDNLSNSTAESLLRVQELTRHDLHFVRADVRDRQALQQVLAEFRIHAVIHFAGLKSVGESVASPTAYYENNVNGTLQLLLAMAEAGVRKLVFSSSATVYGNPARVPIAEDFPLSTTNPYGSSKLVVEGILHDLHAANHDWDIAVLRYFNPTGAHPSGRIGEDPHGVPNNLMPYMAQVAAGRREKLLVFGNNYPTADGTGVRDYIHVVDLARGHLRALEKLDQKPGLITVNLGTGHGYSVLQMLHAFERASGRHIPYEIVARRPGDVATCFADPTRARNLLGWSAERGLDAMCSDLWRWQSMNPLGYADPAGAIGLH